MPLARRNRNRGRFGLSLEVLYIFEAAKLRLVNVGSQKKKWQNVALNSTTTYEAGLH